MARLGRSFFVFFHSLVYRSGRKGLGKRARAFDLLMENDLLGLNRRRGAD